MSVESEKREERERRTLCRKTTAGREERGKDIGRGREGGGGDRDEALANVAPAQVE